MLAKKQADEIREYLGLDKNSNDTVILVITLIRKVQSLEARLSELENYRIRMGAWTGIP